MDKELEIPEVPSPPEPKRKKSGWIWLTLGIIGFIWISNLDDTSNKVNNNYPEDKKASLEEFLDGGDSIVEPTSTPRTTTTKTATQCHPSYSGACLIPNASDYDCAGGSGNGPYYTGRVRVVGPDVFGLDRDGDGVGCE